MPAHDIVDNRKEILVDHINTILGSTEAVRFAVGYFLVSGFTSIAETLKDVKELKLLKKILELVYPITPKEEPSFRSSLKS